MGITGLLPFLDKSSTKCNISRFSGGTVAIDSYCWLHKGAFSCADKLVMGQPTDAYVKYCMKYVQMLLDAKIKPILVFDGRHLPAKAETEVKRRESRKANRKKGADLMRMGNTTEGRNLLRRSLDISHKMAVELIKECQKLNVDCIVAPYEADSQLAYLNISGIADVVITEDSDLTLFGCKKIFFKMDLNGNGVLVEQEKIHLSMNVNPENFSMDKFRHMCILSGCDYLSSLPGIGLGKACKFISKITDCDIQKTLPRMGAYLNMKSLTVTKEYIDSFIKADVTFKHQLVYCPLQRKQVRLRPPGDEITTEQLKYAGEEMADEVLALQCALGNCDPFTFEKLHDFDPDDVKNTRRNTNSWAQEKPHVSIWSKKFYPSNRQIKKKEPPKIPDSSGKVAIMKSVTSTTSTKPVISNTIARKRSYKELDDNSEEDLLRMYMQEPKTETPNSGIVETEPEPTSPVVTRSRVNPFKKIATEESPSYLSKGRKRGLLRFKPTIIDDSAVAQSKFFALNGGSEKMENEVIGTVSDKGSNDKLIEPEKKEIEEITNSSDDGFVGKKLAGNDSIIAEEISKVNMNDDDSVIEDSLPDSIDFLKLHNEEIKPTILANSDDEYFSTDEIPAHLTKWDNPNLNTSVKTTNKSNFLNSSKASNKKSRPSLTKQSSFRKVSAKKMEPIPGQCLLNQFGFQKRPAFKN